MHATPAGQVLLSYQLRILHFDSETGGWSTTRNFFIVTFFADGRTDGQAAHEIEPVRVWCALSVAKRRRRKADEAKELAGPLTQLLVTEPLLVEVRRPTDGRTDGRTRLGGDSYVHGGLTITTPVLGRRGANNLLHKGIR